MSKRGMRESIFSLSHVLVGQGRGEGDFEFRNPLLLEITLILTLSHEYVGEGTGKTARHCPHARCRISCDPSHDGPAMV
jgi:hypothetical protein